ncbi:CMRF35-like molecule 1 [Pagrus major]|uniref:CMRF35-like molecule 1 n=1 Tax=Pagrus major TaxID=143350 RepID=UPI003CC8BFA5
MRKMLLLIIWLSSAVRCQPSKIHVSAQEGGLAEISCPYDSGYETYPKYFYKGIYGKRQSIIETAAGKKGSAQRGKYYIYDDTKRRMLHVTIHNVNLNDAETYWCWIDAYGFDPKTEIELKVYKAPAPPLVTSHPPATTVSDSASTTLWSTTPEDMRTVLPPLTGKRLYLAVAAAVAVAVLLLCLMVLYFKMRKHRHDTGFCEM